MKHVVPLGYVVGCDIRKVNGRLGFRITVESQYPLSIVHKTIEDALEDIDDFLAKMETSEFEMSKAAVMSVKQGPVHHMSTTNLKVLNLQNISCCYLRGYKAHTVILPD